MNPYFSRIVSVLLILLAACKKEDQPVEQHIKPRHAAYGTVTVNRNGQAWPMRVWGSSHTAGSLPAGTAFNICIDRYVNMDGDSIPREFLSLGNLLYKVYRADLEQPVTDTTQAHPYSNTKEYAVYTQIFEDGDVVSLPHSLLLSEPHFVEIISYNPTTTEVSGRFSVSFLSYDKKDTTRWTDGVFNTKIFPE